MRFSVTIQSIAYDSNLKNMAIYSRTSLARTPLEHENMFKTGVVRAYNC